MDDAEPSEDASLHHESVNTTQTPTSIGVGVGSQVVAPTSIQAMALQGENNKRHGRSQMLSGGQEKPPLKYIELVGDYPVPCLCGWCMSCIVFLVLVVASSSSLYVSFTNFPFYVKGHIRYERQEGLVQAKLDADAVPVGLGSTSASPVVYKERQLNLYRLQIIYEASSGQDIWSLENIRKIANLEERIVNGRGKNSKKEERPYSDYCQLIYNKSSGQPMRAVNAYTSSPCRTPLTGIAFLWDQWTPIPYNDEVFPSSVWVQPSNPDLTQCYLPPATSPISFTPGDPYGYLQTFMPATLTAEQFVQLILQDKLCEAGSHIMPHTVVSTIPPVCPIFEACSALLYNTISIQSWGSSLNWMWNYGDVKKYYQSTYARFVDYWSSYGGSASKYSSSALVNLTEAPYAPFLYAQVELSQDATKRQMYPQAMASRIRYVADATFGYPSYGRTGTALISTFYFGGPLTNIDLAWTQIGGDDSGGGEDSTDWTKDFGAWVFDAYHGMLMDFDENEDMKITWQTTDEEVEGDDPMRSIYIVSNVLPKDMMLLIGSFAFVFLYITAVKRSFFLAGLGMTMVLLTAVPTLAIYTILLRQTFVGILQLLSMFIIMGIGADDIFVLLDCYEADRHYHEHELKFDLSAAWRHAAKATLVTSVTTFFSFLSNARSPFPAISTFGFWCCVLIAVNYVSVHTFYLSAVSVYDRYFALKRICYIGDNPRLTVDAFKQGQESANPDSPLGIRGEENFKGVPLLVADKCFPLLWKARYLVAAVWLLLWIMYIIFAATLEPDPDAPNLLPENDPYGQWNDQLIKHFGALDNPYRIVVELVLGIDRETPLNRDGTDAVKPTERGKVNWVSMNPGTDADMVAYQTWMVNMCEDLEAKASRTPGVDLEGLSIASNSDLVDEKVVDCPLLHFRSWLRANGYAWPVPTYSQYLTLIGTYFGESDVENPQSTNYNRWEETLYFMADPSQTYGVTLKLQTIRIALSAQSNMLYTEGLQLTDKWQVYSDRWRELAPSYLRPGFYFTDKYAFHWFVSQDKISAECYSGIALSLVLSYIVLIIASANIVVATLAISSIASIVCSVIAFAVWNGWKLGMLEAIIFVMVIGMSVDYVVHMADAYLESTHENREQRTRFMMGKMAVSVLSGAVTTLGSSFFMVFAHITFFKKFGLIILFTVFQSCLTALVFFSALMACFGPEGTWGDIPFQRCFYWCMANVGIHRSGAAKVAPAQESQSKYT